MKTTEDDYIRIPRRLLVADPTTGSAPLPTNALRVLLFLLDDPSVTPSMKALERACRLSREATQRAVKILIGKGYLARRKRKTPDGLRWAGNFWVVSVTPMTDAQIEERFAKLHQEWRASGATGSGAGPS